MLVEDLMRKPIIIERDMSLTEIAKLMTKHSLNSLIVFLEKKVCGVVSARDLIAHFGEQKKVSEVMNKKFVSVKSGDKIQKAFEILREKEVSLIPVLDKTDSIVGALYIKDILNEACENEDFLID